MALEVKAEAVIQPVLAEYFNYTDTTGNYSTTNLGGFGGQIALVTAQNIAANKIVSTAHGLVDGDRVFIDDAGSVTGISTGQSYFVINATTNDYELATTLGGVNVISGGTVGTLAIEKYVNKAISTIDKSEIVIKEGDLTAYGSAIVMDSTTTPSADFIPVNALTREISPLDATTTDTKFQDRVWLFFYKLYFNITGTFTLSGTTITSGVGGLFNSIYSGFGDTDVVLVEDANQNLFEVGIASKTSTVLTLEQTTGLADGPVTIYAVYSAEAAASVIEQLKTCFYPKIADISVEELCSCSNTTIKELNTINIGITSIEQQMEQELYAKANADIKTLNKICAATSCC